MFLLTCVYMFQTESLLKGQLTVKNISQNFISHYELNHLGHKGDWKTQTAYETYRKISNIRRTLVGNKIVDHSDVVGASPVGAAPTTSSFSTWHLASRDSAKTAASQYENLLSVGIWCVLYQRLDGNTCTWLTIMWYVCYPLKNPWRLEHSSSLFK